MNGHSPLEFLKDLEKVFSDFLNTKEIIHVELSDRDFTELSKYLHLYNDSSKPIFVSSNNDTSKMEVKYNNCHFLFTNTKLSPNKFKTYISV
jgi:hypothetical protein